MKARIIFGAIAAAVLLSACGQPTVQVTKLGAWQARPHTRDIEVFRDASAITRPYREIAILTADDEALDLRHELKGALQKKARELGADAILIQSEEQIKARGPQIKWTGLIVPAAEHNIMHAVALHYKD